MDLKPIRATEPILIQGSRDALGVWGRDHRHVNLIRSLFFPSLCCCLHLGMCPPSYCNKNWTNCWKTLTKQETVSREWLCLRRGAGTAVHVCVKMRQTETKEIHPLSKQFKWYLTLTLIMSNIIQVVEKYLNSFQCKFKLLSSNNSCGNF